MAQLPDLPLLRCDARVRILVGANDALDEIVANDILFAELRATDAFDFAADLQGFDKAALFAGWQIDLGDVAGDDGFGVEAEARQEHFHLFAGGVLRFVEDDERIVSVRPRMKASGAISMIPFSKKVSSLSASSIS